LNLSLELLVSDVFVDLLPELCLDTHDEIAEDSNVAAARRLRRAPVDGLEVDAATNEFGVQHVDDLLGDKVAGCDESEGLLALA